jgi:hypothetical protein
VALAREGAALGEALVDPSALGLDLPLLAEAAFSAVMSHHDSAQRKVRRLRRRACASAGSALLGPPVPRASGVGRMASHLVSLRLVCACPDHAPLHESQLASLPAQAHCTGNPAMALPLMTLRHAPQAALESVLVCGGGSAAPGASQRVLRDLRALAPPSFTPAPVVLPEYMPAATPRCAAAPGSMCYMGRRQLWTPNT